MTENMKPSRPAHSPAATLLLVLLFAAPASVVAAPGAEATWEVACSGRGIRSYRGVIPGSPLLAFKAEITLDRGV